VSGESPDIVVIGAGAIGASTALHLARRTMSASAGSSYGPDTPVNSSIIPARAMASRPFRFKTTNTSAWDRCQAVIEQYAVAFSRAQHVSR
jgi:predicted dinucleotide-binding enzyme